MSRGSTKNHCLPVLFGLFVSVFGIWHVHWIYFFDMVELVHCLGCHTTVVTVTLADVHVIGSAENYTLLIMFVASLKWFLWLFLDCFGELFLFFVCGLTPSSSLVRVFQTRSGSLLCGSLGVSRRCRLLCARSLILILVERRCGSDLNRSRTFVWLNRFLGMCLQL